MPKKGGFDLGKELSLNRKKYFLFSRLMKESPQKLKLRQLCKYAAVAPPNHSSELLSYLGDQHPRNYTAVPTTTKVYRYAELSRHRYIIQISRILCTKSRMKSFFSWKKNSQMACSYNRGHYYSVNKPSLFGVIYLCLGKFIFKNVCTFISLSFFSI